MHQPPSKGQTIARIYKVTDILAVRGQAFPIKAMDRRTRQSVFIKMLKSSRQDTHYAADVARFEREAGVALSSPVAVNPLAYLQEADRHYIVFPWVEGFTLEVYVRERGGHLSVDEVLRILRALVEVLREAHGKGLVHRDLKPDNIIIQPDGSPRLLDWGILKSTNTSTIANPDDVLGTLEYMSPEHILTPWAVDARSDLYCLSGILWHSLTGLPPASGRNFKEIGESVCETILPPLTSLDPAAPRYLSDVLARLAEKDPARRFQCAEELQDALDRKEVTGGGCPACGASLPGDTPFCTSCGTKVGAAEQAPVCLACGTATDGSARCHGCGCPFGAVEHIFENLDRPWRGRRLRAPEGSCRVCRNQLDAADPRISRSHADSTCFNGTLQVQDLGSVNGTFVDGRPATQPTLLVSGQIIVFGPIPARYMRKENHS